MLHIINYPKDLLKNVEAGELCWRSRDVDTKDASQKLASTRLSADRGTVFVASSDVCKIPLPGESKLNTYAAATQ